MDFNTSQFPENRIVEAVHSDSSSLMSRTFGETPWHRNWKKVFPPAFREVSFADKDLGELHRADVYTSCGTTLEFQNSPICIQELESIIHIVVDSLPMKEAYI